MWLQLVWACFQHAFDIERLYLRKFDTSMENPPSTPWVVYAQLVMWSRV